MSKNKKNSLSEKHGQRMYNNSGQNSAVLSPQCQVFFKDKQFSIFHGKEGQWQPLPRPGGQGRAKIGQRTRRQPPER
jgi:hypothetical protein